jgi:hypothetical protein
MACVPRFVTATISDSVLIRFRHTQGRSRRKCLRGITPVGEKKILLTQEHLTRLKVVQNQIIQDGVSYPTESLIGSLTTRVVARFHVSAEIFFLG